MSGRVEKTERPDNDGGAVEDRFAQEGDGNGEPLSSEQVSQLKNLFDEVVKEINTEYKEEDQEWLLQRFLNLETCRRYLVARSWSSKKAKAQLKRTLAWRTEKKQVLCLPLAKSPKCIDNPYALSMRVVGYDIEGRPVIYTCFSQASDRYDVSANIQHMTSILEECSSILEKRRLAGLNIKAKQLQWVLAIDFHGFGVWDQNPKTALLTAHLMAHYPEMLHMGVLINAPALFSAMWKIISNVLDDRVAAKVAFVKVEELAEKLGERLGTEIVNWVVEEANDNRKKRAKNEKKAYWVKPEDEKDHDPRGVSSYVDSEYYIKTPGDAFVESNN